MPTQMLPEGKPRARKLPRPRGN